MAWQLLESSELMCSLTQCNRNAVGSRIPWDSSRPFPQKSRHWFGEKKTVTLWDSCHAPLCTSPVTPSKVFYFLVRPEGLPKKSRLSYPLYRWEVRPGRSSICQFFGEFLKPVGCKTKKLQKKKTPFKLRSHRVSVASYPSLQLGVQVPSWGTSGPSLHVIGEAYWINEGAGHGSPKHSHKVANFPAKHWINETLEW